MNASSHPASDVNVDPREVERFARLANEWWDPKGKFRPLHKLGPARLQFIRDQAAAHFGRSIRSLRPLDGLTILDFGCGGGLVSEPLARMGGHVTGIDPAAENVAAASEHATRQGLAITYRAAMAETLVGEGLLFDVVLCLEVIEHVPDQAALIATCARLVRPGGLLVASTINRTMKSYALAIVGAEYILRWLPVGTHQWERFVTPAELTSFIQATGLGPTHAEGLVFNPLADMWSLSGDTDVNYMMSAAKPLA